MSLWDRILAELERKREAEQDALDSQIIEALWEGQREELPRVVRLSRVNRGDGYVIPGKLWPDGKSRLLVNPLQAVNEPAAIEQMDREDARSQE